MNANQLSPCNRMLKQLFLLMSKQLLIKYCPQISSVWRKSGKKDAVTSYFLDAVNMALKALHTVQIFKCPSTLFIIKDLKKYEIYFGHTFQLSFIQALLHILAILYFNRQVCFLVLLRVLPSPVRCLENGTEMSVEELMEDLFHPDRYNKKIRPGANDGESVKGQACFTPRCIF